MSQNELNNKFRDKLGGYSSDIDQDQLWGAIADDVPTKKERRRGIFWFWSFACFVLIGLAGICLIDRPDLCSEGQVSNGNFTFSNNIQNSELDNTPLLMDTPNEKLSSEGHLLENDKWDEVADLVERNPENGVGSYNVTSDIKAKDISTKNKSYNPKAKEVKKINKIPRSSDVKNKIRKPSIQESSIDYIQNIENRKDLSLEEFSLIPTKLDHLQIPVRPAPLMKRVYKKKKRIKPIKRQSHIFQLNYTAGNYKLDRSLTPDNGQMVNDGDAYFAQGIEMKYGHKLTSKFYAIASLNYDVKYKHFQAVVQRDTVVPSSVGEQLLATNIYANGTIDNISGVPEVVASFSRSVSNLNTDKSLNLGLGLGYLMKMKEIRIYMEGLVSRSIYTNRSGLGMVNNTQRIINLSSISNQYTSEPNYDIGLEVGVSFPIHRKICLVGGVHYQKGLTNQISSLRGSEYYGSLKGVFGIRINW